MPSQGNSSVYYDILDWPSLILGPFGLAKVVFSHAARPLRLCDYIYSGMPLKTASKMRPSQNLHHFEIGGQSKYWTMHSKCYIVAELQPPY